MTEQDASLIFSIVPSIHPSSPDLSVLNHEDNHDPSAGISVLPRSSPGCFVVTSTYQDASATSAPDADTTSLQDVSSWVRLLDLGLSEAELRRFVDFLGFAGVDVPADTAELEVSLIQRVNLPLPAKEKFLRCVRAQFPCAKSGDATKTAAAEEVDQQAEDVAGARTSQMPRTSQRRTSLPSGATTQSSRSHGSSARSIDSGSSRRLVTRVSSRFSVGRTTSVGRRASIVVVQSAKRNSYVVQNARTIVPWKLFCELFGVAACLAVFLAALVSLYILNASLSAEWMVSECYDSILLPASPLPVVPPLVSSTPGEAIPTSLCQHSLPVLRRSWPHLWMYFMIPSMTFARGTAIVLIALMTFGRKRLLAEHRPFGWSQGDWGSPQTKHKLRKTKHKPNTTMHEPHDLYARVGLVVWCAVVVSFLLLNLSSPPHLHPSSKRVLAGVTLGLSCMFYCAETVFD